MNNGRINFIPASDIRIASSAGFGIRNARHAYAMTTRHDNVIMRILHAIFG